MNTVILLLCLLSLDIKGETQVAPHKLVRLSVDESGKENGFIWDIDQEDKADILEAGNKLYFTAPPGVYRVKVRKLDFTTRKIETARCVVTIGLPSPGPDPTPPEPQPVPVLTKQVREWLKKVDLPAEVKAKDAKAFAGNFRSIAAAIAAGAIKDLDAALAQTNAMNRATGGERREQWLALFEPLAAELEKSLTTLEQAKTLWLAIAEGLE